MVFIEEAPGEEQREPGERLKDLDDAHPRIRQLEQELRSTKECLQTTIEELETSNEELKSTNEELQSSNEELQSTNEELETSKDELQSVNEELTTVNTELQNKIEELSKTSSDLNNLLASTEIGTVFLDTDLRIQRFTPAITKFINLIQTEVGRPIGHIVSNMYYDNLSDDAREVPKTLHSKELEVQTKDGRSYMKRILPCRTVENVIDGVVVTFIDITSHKELQQELQTMSKVFMEAIDPIIIEDLDGTILELNREAEEVYGWTKQELVGQSIKKIVPPEAYGKSDELRDKIRQKVRIRNVKAERVTKSGDIKPVLLSLFLLTEEASSRPRIVSVARHLPDQA